MTSSLDPQNIFFTLYYFTFNLYYLFWNQKRINLNCQAALKFELWAFFFNFSLEFHKKSYIVYKTTGSSPARASPLSNRFELLLFEISIQRKQWSLNRIDMDCSLLIQLNRKQFVNWRSQAWFDLLPLTIKCVLICIYWVLISDNTRYDHVFNRLEIINFRFFTIHTSNPPDRFIGFQIKAWCQKHGRVRSMFVLPVKHFNF